MYKSTIVIIKLITGEEIIGEFAPDFFNDNDQQPVIVLNPFYILSASLASGMVELKLKDAVMVCNDCSVSLKKSSIISHYTPKPSMIDYYKKTVEYNEKVVKPIIDLQMEYGIQDLEEAIKQDTDKLKEITEYMIKSTNSSIQ